jgi:hypothetical protein
MFLNGGETHGVEGSKTGHRVFIHCHAAHDVPACGIGERLEQAV